MGKAGVTNKGSHSANQCGWDRLDPGNLWRPSDQHSWVASARLFAWLRTDIHRKIKIKKEDLVLWQTNNRLWDFALNILNNPISSLDKWGCFTDRVYVSIYFPCTSVWRSLSTPAEVSSVSGAYPFHQVWENEAADCVPCEYEANNSLSMNSAWHSSVYPELQLRLPQRDPS